MKPGRELYAHNRRRTAERFDWPAGIVEQCEWIDVLNPGWLATWRPGPGMPRGFYAQHEWHRHLEPEVYAQTAEELDAAIRSHQCPGSKL